MAIRPLPDTELLRKLIEYRPATGELVWRARSAEIFNDERRSISWAYKAWNTKNAGKKAFSNPHGARHLSGTLLGQVHLAHRVAWAIHFGISEFGLIDHINGDGRDNRIGNLRLANREMNAQNARQRHDCSSGVTGVHWHVNKRWGKPIWEARIQCGKKRIRLGSFDKLEDAISARLEAEKKYGFGPVHGTVKP